MAPLLIYSTFFLELLASRNLFSCLSVIIYAKLTIDISVIRYLPPDMPVEDSPGVPGALSYLNSEVRRSLLF